MDEPKIIDGVLDEEAVETPVVPTPLDGDKISGIEEENGEEVELD